MAELQAFSGLYVDMEVDLPGIMEPMMLKALQHGARKLCDEIEVWEQQLDSMNLVEDKALYYLDWDYCAYCKRVIEVRRNTEARVDEGLEGGILEPEYYEFNPPDELEFDDSVKPGEDIARALDVKVVLVPHWEACELPVWFFNRWIEPIKAYAMYWLMRMRGKSWYNPEEANAYFLEWKDGRSRAAAERQMKHKRQSMYMEA